MPGGLITIMTSPHGSQQDRVPMVVQELPLAFGERADIHNTHRLDAHAVQRGVWATGDTIRSPESKLMNSRSKR